MTALRKLIPDLRYQLIEKRTNKIMLESMNRHNEWWEMDGKEWEIHDIQTGFIYELEEHNEESEDD